MKRAALLFFLLLFLLPTSAVAQEQTAASSGTIEVENTSNVGPARFLVPKLGAPLPTLDDNSLISGFFSGVNEVQSNILGVYLQAWYDWLLVVGSLLAVFLMMLAGLERILARGKAESIKRSNNRIRAAFTGLILLLTGYTISFFFDPSTTVFESLSLTYIDQQLNHDTSGLEGIAGLLSSNASGTPTFSGTSTGGVSGKNCNEAIANAKSSGTCSMTMTFGSPTGSAFSCNYHFSQKNYNYAKINAVDYPASFGSEILAPFDGTVTYTEGDGTNLCGNAISLSGSGAYVSICHVKDFIDANGNAIASGTKVSKGDVIGHVGGNCCRGENAPKSWSQHAQCNKAGPPCTDPNSNESCNCQTWKHAGNTSGPHVHITLSAGGNFLACIE